MGRFVVWRRTEKNGESIRGKCIAWIYFPAYSYGVNILYYPSAGAISSTCWARASRSAGSWVTRIKVRPWVWALR